jgi:hypothetical protein
MDMKVKMFFYRFVYSLIYFAPPIFSSYSREGILFWLLIFVESIIYITHIFVFSSIYKGIFEKRIKRNIKPGNDTGHNSITITKENMMCTGTYFDAKVSWELFDKLEESKNYIFLYINHLASKACAIPKRAFRDEAEKNEFINLIKVYSYSL